MSANAIVLQNQPHFVSGQLIVPQRTSRPNVERQASGLGERGQEHKKVDLPPDQNRRRSSLADYAGRLYAAVAT